MFQNLSRYVYTWLPQTTSSPAAEGVETNTTPPPSRLSSSRAEEDWVLVDHREDSDGNSKWSSRESLCDDDDDDGILIVEDSPDRVVVLNTNHNHHPVPALLTRTNSLSSLPNASMETSWFLTPPPCFISQGPVHMETSPLENLLIEHPSMSVYVHHGRRYNFATVVPPAPESLVEAEVVEVEVDDEAGGEGVVDVVLVRRVPHLNRVQVLQQQKQQTLKSKQAQKVQINMACKFVKRSSLNHNNKAREVNCRNRRQRRGERSQGPQRSFANNNRKC